MRVPIIDSHSSCTTYLKITQTHLACTNGKVNGKRTKIRSFTGNRYLGSCGLIKACVSLFQSVWLYIVFIDYGIICVTVHRVFPTETICAMTLTIILGCGKHFAFTVG